MPDDQSDPEFAAISISRMSSPEVIRLRVVIDREIIDMEMSLGDFTLALTGRGDVPAKIVRRLKRP